MPAPEPPLLLVDVDGVLSLFGGEVDHAGCTPALVDGILVEKTMGSATTTSGSGSAT